MESRIDLDEAARLIEARRAEWSAAGIQPDELTWRDEESGWPPPITTNRAQAVVPDSVGVCLRKGEQYGRVVLFKGGWADLEYWDADPGIDVHEAPGWEDWLDLNRFDQLLNRLTALFR
ncbi:hypothetical protein [Allobranchiibius huperziae]|uniref:Uncharacterized protein n=1 Tax=Allobranchiibius huperziae TaxID=1874116 RepID=A0A853DFM8_9MICO|nr:hypothetical protein [Allobranchiibius huperziae]NYJ75608.1 hypothetical protein [Allobranchiibius huperziae]